MQWFQATPPGEPSEQPKPPPPWVGPGEQELGELLPIRLLLARSDRAAVAVTELVAYRNGFEIAVSLRLRSADLPPGRSGIIPGMPGFVPGIPGFVHRSREPDKPIPPDIFRFGVQFSDGRRGMTFGEPIGGQFRGKPDEEPKGPVLIARLFGGGGRRADFRYWVWPLPPQGPLTLACEWPAQGIPVSTKDLDSAPILEASASAELLWEEDADSADGG